MDLLKKALDRAKQNRSSVVNAVPPLNMMAKNVESSISHYFEYTETRCIKIPREQLEKNRIIEENGRDPISDAYRLLRTKVLKQCREQAWNVLAITSPNIGEGKTVTAINLAISLAREVNHTVLLVDLDLRRPTIHQVFGLKGHWGISDYLFDDIPVEHILFSPGIDRLAVLPGNAVINNSSEMLSSPKMVSLIEEIKQRYLDRIIIFDLPPLLIDDVMVLEPYIDATMLVVSEGQTEQQQLKQALQVLGNMNFLGTILNKARVGKKLSYY